MLNKTVTFSSLLMGLFLFPLISSTTANAATNMYIQNQMTDQPLTSVQYQFCDYSIPQKCDSVQMIENIPPQAAYEIPDPSSPTYSSFQIISASSQDGWIFSGGDCTATSIGLSFFNISKTFVPKILQCYRAGK